jgi:hypothetical protein
MRKHTKIALVLAGCLAIAPMASLALGASSAPKKPAPVGSRVHFAGCTRAGVEGCLVVVTSQGTYDITGTTPPPALSRSIEGTGVIAGGVTSCMQGSRLKQVKWKYSRKPIACADEPVSPSH